MAVSLDQKRIALETFLQDHTNIKYVTPAAPEFSSLKATYNLTITATPLAIVRPQSSNDVAALVSYCTTHGIQFSVRSGGNNLYGASCVQDALMVDMRDIAFVDIDKEKSSARVGGGILQGKLAKELSKEGLVTAMGSLGFVGFIGWGCYGGYGSLSAKYGLGVDNILAAKVVNWNGEIVDADEEMMKGIRGAGGAFGVIVELTVKVYPLKSILAGMIVFDSQDITSVYQSYNAGYQTLLDEGLSPALSSQQMVVNSPNGRAFAVGIIWSSDDHDAGRAELAKIEALGTVVMNTVGPTTVADYMDILSTQIPSSAYGACQTLSIRKLNNETTAIMSRNFEKMPSSFGTAFTIHELRGPSAAPKSNSVFGLREPHFMLEFISTVAKEEDEKESREWATNFRKELLQMKPENLLPGTYISLTPPGVTPLSKIYGPDSNYETLLELKQKYDPHNVFNLAVPKFYEQ